MNQQDKKYFLPYQVKWLSDPSPVKVWEKARRIGATYVQAYEDVKDCATKVVPAVWFSSADESAAKEYIIYCAQWAQVLNIAANDLGQVLLDSDREIRTFAIEFANGTRINALSSNPKAFRSKGGKVVLDEFAHHDNPVALWKAAKPAITWGFPLRILSTHNGQQSLFYRFIKEIEAKKLGWSLHKITVLDAVEQGLLDKIVGRKTTKSERKEWIDDLRKDCFDENTWLEEYNCIPVDEATAFLPYDLIGSCEMHDLIVPPDRLTGDLFLGMDIGRKKDLSVIWLLERTGVKYTRFIKIFEKASFKVQREALFQLLSHPNMRRACIDATGLGMQLAEEAQQAFGKYKVEAVTFTSKVKEELAYGLRTDFEDRTIRIPSDPAIREDLHSLRKITTSAGNVRFDVMSSEKLDSHADRFWALALAAHAGATDQGPIFVVHRQRRMAPDIVEGYEGRGYNRRESWLKKLLKGTI